LLQYNLKILPIAPEIFLVERVSEHSRLIELLDGPLFFSSGDASSDFPSSSGFPIPLASSSSVIELSDPGPVGL